LKPLRGSPRITRGLEDKEVIMTKQTTWKPVTGARYDEMLGVVPPLYHSFQGFLVGEAVSGRTCSVTGRDAPTFDAFMRRADGFYECTEALTFREYHAIERHPGEITILPADQAPPKPA